MNHLLDGLDPQLLGGIAGTLTTLAFFPQAWKTWRRRSADDISGVTFTLFTIGVALWLLYGWLLNLWPVVLANGITLVLSALILLAKWRFRPSR